MGIAAVRFVLNDVFSGLRADDRQKLLHVSSSHLTHQVVLKARCVGVRH